MVEDVIKAAYLDIMKTEYGERELWTYFSQSDDAKALTASMAYEGKEYEKCDKRLMIVGRAMNGLETDFSACNSAESVVDTVFGQKSLFPDVINRAGFKRDGKKPYRYITSKFWKLIKFLLEEYGEANAEWYDINKNLNWNEKIVWSNLYKMSPRLANNPSLPLMRATIRNNVKILQEEIEIHKPERILFVTDRWFLEPFEQTEQTPSFAQALNIRFFNEESAGTVIGCGQYGKAKIIVCKRPDVWGNSDNTVRDMAKDIKNAFDSKED